MVSHGLYMQRMFYETVTNGTSQADTDMLADAAVAFGAGRNVTLMNIVVGATVVLHPPPYQIRISPANQ